MKYIKTKRLSLQHKACQRG